ncbi:2-dehydropantoate 2-reductase [Alteromonadaceae bacterium BrNp21-10]|nr:2-dehydropantoate 2-reductase [Alteromonadaceae bacterium BrNp21-10]
MNQHCILGAGLIGSYIGGVLHSRGYPVHFVRRRATERVDLHLTDYQGHQQTIPDIDYLAVANCADIIHSDIDYLWLTVKCTAISQSLIDMQDLISKKTIILCCQNGIGSEQLVQQAFPNNSVLRVMVPFNVVEAQSGHFHRGSEGHLVIEQDQQGHATTLQQALYCELLPTSVCADMQAMQWAKLQLNLSNAVNALSNMPVKAMLQQRGYRLVIAALMQELLQVAQAKGFELPRLTALPAHWLPFVLRLPNGLFSLLANKMLAIDPTVRTSMWWDVHHQRATEVNFLNGAVVAHGQRLNIHTPCNQRIVDLIKQAETRKSMQAFSPAELLKAIVGKDC